MHVGVGAQPGDVVDAPDRHVARAISSKSFSTSRASASRSALVVAAERLAQVEHRPHRVADRVVEVLGELAAVRGSRSCVLLARRAASCVISVLLGRRSWSSTCAGGRLGRWRCRPGCPARRTPRRRPRGPGRAATASRIRRTRSRWPTAYCGSAAAPPLHVASTGVAASPTASREVGAGRGRRAPRRGPGAGPPRGAGRPRCAAAGPARRCAGVADPVPLLRTSTSRP